MRIRLKISIAGSAGVFAAGMLADLPNAMAKGLIEAGHAETIKAEAENAMMGQPETAQFRHGKPRGMQRKG